MHTVTWTQAHNHTVDLKQNQIQYVQYVNYAWKLSIGSMNSGSGVKWAVVLLLVSSHMSRVVIYFNEPASQGEKLNLG